MRALETMNKKPIKQEEILFFDIETAPVVKELEIDSPLFNAWEYKTNKKKELTDTEVVRNYSQEAGLYWEFARIVSIVVGKVIDGEIFLATFDDADEKKLLERFNRMLDRNVKARLCGWAIKGFDLPFVSGRCIINQVPLHDKIDVAGQKPWEVECIDLAELWQGSGFRRSPMVACSTALGLPSPKSDIDGSQVGEVYWSEGEKGLARISKYCRRDVATCVNIYRKFLYLDPLPIHGVDDDDQDEAEGAMDATGGLLEHIYHGGSVSKDQVNTLEEGLKSLPQNLREAGMLIVEAIPSKSKDRTTALTAQQVRGIKTRLNNGKK